MPTKVEDRSMKWAAPKLPANGLKWVWLLAVVLNAGTLFAFGQSDGDVSLKGAIDIHAYQSPDSVARVMDADDLARYAKEKGMRGLVMKNHYEDTAAIVFMIRKEVPGIELY